MFTALIASRTGAAVRNSVGIRAIRYDNDNRLQRSSENERRRDADLNKTTMHWRGHIGRHAHLTLH